jgi:hypothetical protein
MKEQINQGKRSKLDIENKIVEHFTKIKSLCDSGISSINKEGKSDFQDISNTNKLTDSIFQEIENIRDLLFELEDFLSEDSEE